MYVFVVFSIFMNYHKIRAILNESCTSSYKVKIILLLQRTIGFCAVHNFALRLYGTPCNVYNDGKIASTVFKKKFKSITFAPKMHIKIDNIDKIWNPGRHPHIASLNPSTDLNEFWSNKNYKSFLMKYFTWKCPIPP